MKQLGLLDLGPDKGKCSVFDQSSVFESSRETHPGRPRGVLLGMQETPPGCPWDGRPRGSSGDAGNASGRLRGSIGGAGNVPGTSPGGWFA